MLERKYLFPHVIEMNYQAGHRLGVNVYLIDGGSAQNLSLGVATLQFDPPVEAMQEFKVEANSFGAEFGHANGGVVNAVTRSGSPIRPVICKCSGTR